MPGAQEVGDVRWQAEHAGSVADAVKQECDWRSYVRVGPPRNTNSYGGSIAHKICFEGS
jgi:hypothetical protein